MRSFIASALFIVILLGAQQWVAKSANASQPQPIATSALPN